ncbi:MAG: hypothetical protein Tsb009_18190 [Planctomycetaceae bacterium]
MKIQKIADDSLVGILSVSGKATEKRTSQILKIPLMTIRAIVFQMPETSLARMRLEQTIFAYREKNDLLILRNGDRLSGQFHDLDNRSLTFGKSRRKNPIQRVRALLFDSRYIEFPKLEKRHVLMKFRDGSSLTAKQVSLNLQKQIQIQAAYGETFTIPLSAVAALRVLRGRAISLSNWTPEKYEYTPFLDGAWKWMKNRNVLGGRLMLRGREYSRGIGLHSHSRLTYELQDEFHHFLATVGIDDIARGKGNVRVAVEVDGKRVFVSPYITGKSLPLQVGPIPLSGKKKLTLVVEFGQFGDVGDIVDWCDAVLVK